ncbi:MAG: hypothetical protein OJF50_006723 [Nitrospira sp.]|jgi:hypothetical protein|nr:hypothetical protein [Nitrospira sp.]
MSVRHSIHEEEERPCSKCGERPRAHKQRWCPVCRAEWKRAHRHQATRKNPLGNTLNASDGTGNSAPSHGISPAVDERPDAFLGMAADPISQPHGRPVVPPEEADNALSELSHAWEEYEAARSRDWRTSRHAPGTILGPFAQRLRAAETRCRQLGLTVSRVRCSP